MSYDPQFLSQHRYPGFILQGFTMCGYYYYFLIKNICSALVSFLSVKLCTILK